jgi:PAN domain
MSVKSIFCFFFAVLVFTQSSSSAEIRVDKELFQGYPVIRIDGPIDVGDDLVFQSDASKFDKALVFLSGQGGAIEPALAIGKSIRERNFFTIVPTNADCAALCGIAWLGGVKRFVFVGGRVDFHGPFDNPKKEMINSKSADMLGNYLKNLNILQGVIAHITCAPERRVSWIDDSNYELRVVLSGKCPTTTSWLSPSIANLIGSIDVVYLNIESESNWLNYRRRSLAAYPRVYDAPEQQLSSLNFVEKDGLDIVGLGLNGIDSHLGTVDPLYVPNDKACKFQCRSEKGCLAYVYAAATEQCTLISKIQTAIKGSGTKIGFAENPDWKFSLSPFETVGDGYLKGKDLLNFQGTTLFDCLQRCDKNSKCSGFNVSGDKCFLKTGLMTPEYAKQILPSISMRRAAGPVTP